MSKALQDIEQYTQNMLQQMLSQCTRSQVSFFFFNRLFPNGVPKEKIKQAILLVERTLEKNKKRM